MRSCKLPHGAGKNKMGQVRLYSAHATPMSSTGHPHVIAYILCSSPSHNGGCTVLFCQTWGQFDTTILSTVKMPCLAKITP